MRYASIGVGEYDVVRGQRSSRYIWAHEGKSEYYVVRAEEETESYQNTTRCSVYPGLPMSINRQYVNKKKKDVYGET